MNKSKCTQPIISLKESHSKSAGNLPDSIFNLELYDHFQQMANEMEKLTRNISNFQKTGELFKKRFHKL